MMVCEKSPLRCSSVGTVDNDSLSGVVAFSLPAEKEERAVRAVVEMRNGNWSAEGQAVIVLMECLPRLAQ